MTDRNREKFGGESEREMGKKREEKLMRKKRYEKIDNTV